ncbi:phosphodiester glycosidase family protein [Chitinophaga lutea]
MKRRYFLYSLLMLASSMVCKAAGKDSIYTITKRYDETSATWYFLTHIQHTDNKGRLVKLLHSHAARDSGETVREFAGRAHCRLAFNASTQKKAGSPIRVASGIQIVDGKIVQDAVSTAYTLGIKDNNELVAYHPSVRAAEILKDGTNNALTAFVPLIENHQPVSAGVLAIRKGNAEKHPRQIIAQLDNLDLLFLSCGGRGYDGEGMDARDVIRILQALNVKFAFMLDGGGSTSVVVNGALITTKIDQKGTAERPRPNFLYIQ